MLIRTTVATLCLGLLAVPAATAQPPASIQLMPVVQIGGLSAPVFVTHAGDGSGRLYIVERPGRIQVLEDGRLDPHPFLDISDRVLAGGERGLLGLAFHPDFATNGRYFVNYTRQPDGATVVSKFRAALDPGRSGAGERVTLMVEQPYRNHNGGMITFGPDGYLYIGMGDGGSRGDPHNLAQDPNELLGKMLRIDVDGGEPYAIPADNPFADGVQGRPEIYALGLRNPWRFAFDRETGELYAADVGQNRMEELNIIRRGGNYGWRIMEGTLCFEPRTDCDPTSLELPIAEYENAGRRCSITGGYVYRGEAVPELEGTYVFGDYCSGEIFGLRDGEQSVLLQTDLAIASFGEDEAGELYVVGLGGTVHRITGAESAPERS